MLLIDLESMVPNHIYNRDSSLFETQSVYKHQPITQYSVINYSYLPIPLSLRNAALLGSRPKNPFNESAASRAPPGAKIFER